MNGTSPRIGRWAFWLYLTAATTWSFLYLLANNKADWDLWGIMSFGALLDQNPGYFPYRDPFSFTAFDHPWIYHEWGSGVVFYQLFKLWGSPALFWLKSALVLGTLFIGCRTALRKLPGSWNAILFNLALLPVVYLMLPICATTVRCQYFTFFGYALFLWMLERQRQKPGDWIIYTLPAWTVLWVNLHGGFIVGLFAIGVYFLRALFARESAFRLWVVLLLCLVATLLNPYGLAFWSTMLSAWSLPRSGISEWGNVLTLDSVPFYGLLYGALLVLGVGAALRRWLKAPRQFPLPLVILLYTGINGWQHYKLAPLYLISLLSLGFQQSQPGVGLNNPTPESLIPADLPEPSNALPRTGLSTALEIGFRILVGWLVPIGLTILAVMPTWMLIRQTPEPFHTRVPGVETVQTNSVLTRYAYPLGTVDYLKEHLVSGGNLWVPFAWGEFLYWNLYPNFRISIDGRYETVYPPEVYADTERFYHPPYDLSLARRYGSTHVLVPVYESALLDKMRNEPGWRLLYEDHTAALFARSGQTASRANSSTGRLSALNRKKSHQPGAGENPEQSRLMEVYLGDLSRFRLPSRVP